MQQEVNRTQHFIIAYVIMSRAAIALFLGAFCLSTPARGETFEEVLRHVDETHPALQAGREGLEVSQEVIHEAYSGFFPTATTDYARGKQDIKFNTQPRNRQDITTKNLTVVQPLFNGGETIAQVGEAENRHEAAEARFSQIHQEVLLNAISAYTAVKENTDLVHLTQGNVDALNDLLQATRKQFKAAEVTVTDVAQSEARLARATAELHDAQAALQDARAAYLRHVGWQPEVTEFPPLPEGLPISQEEIQHTLLDHPAIVEAQANEKAAEYTVDQRLATILPDVNVEGQINDVEGSSLPTVYTRKDRSVVVRVSVPLYQSGAEYARLRQARHQYQQSRSQTQDVTRGTREIALREWNNYQAAAKAIEEHGAALQAVNKSLKAVRMEQRAGTRTLVDVLNEQDALYLTQVNLLRAQSRRCLSAYRLLAAMGSLDRVLESTPGPSPP